MRSFLILSASLMLLVVYAGCATLGTSRKTPWQSPYRDISLLKPDVIVHLPTGVAVTKEQLFESVAQARIVYVGEIHDNMNDHKIQLEILKALNARRPGQIAVGMEMLKRPSQDIADQWTSGKLDEKSFMKTWNQDWTNDYDYYRDILEYLRDNRIPLIALRASDDWLMKLKSPQSAESHDEDKGGEAPMPEMDFDDPYHRFHTKALFSGHPGHALDFDAFYKVQVLWDESMAQSIYEYLQTDDGRDKQVVIFAGRQHVAFGYGIPRRMFRRFPAFYVIVIPVIVEKPEEENRLTMAVSLPEVPLLPGDFAWGDTYETLKDEKVRLGVMIEENENGVRILKVVKHSAAETAGLVKDDRIATFDGEPIKTSFDLTYLLGLKKPGDNGVVEVYRNNEKLRFEVTFKKKNHQ